MYEDLAGALVDEIINTHQSRAARYGLPILTAFPANTTPVSRDVRRAIKIFSYTVHGAFFLIFQKEWGVQTLHREPVRKERAADSRPYSLWYKRRAAPKVQKSHCKKAFSLFTTPFFYGIVTKRA